ncbi:GAF domain-containing sensor histidine kinase [Algoriphagus sp. AGSA1]|uniref:GAF domain-containing sensor histidine kinase n=1 Tax=Algoriphagus sp. AGSA1 TaxID=2907213 RepID=UPI001F29EE71|nr:GAF domain-containing sensor histidine kinase [Algoriphagus sp. AGSA1]MCE7058001.1 GAF domain-containing sensor histidine kinase [Algoriphagus sp. AGSA1]
MNQFSTWNENELDRLLALSNLGIDYYEPKQGLDFLTELAAKVSGTEISLINLIDSFTQWSVSTYGIEINQMPREDSVCQYTIQSNGGHGFEVDDLAKDIRFKDKFYVAGAPNLRYYMGVPLTSPEGYNLGALCVMDPNLMRLSDGVKDILRLIAQQIVDRLRVNNMVVNLKAKCTASELNQKKLAHDIRGPIGGILGLSNLMLDEEQTLERSEMEEYVGMIRQSSLSLLDLSNDILGRELRGDSRKVPQLGEDETNLVKLRDTIVQLLTPQLRVKKINFEALVDEENKYESFSKLYVLQILGNLLSNSIKFTETGGLIVLNLKLIREQFDLILAIEVSDTGLGMSQEKVGEILRGEIPSTQKGTGGEQGFGLGLTLVSQLVKEKNGNLQIHSEPGKGTSFKIEMQVN